MAKAKRVRVGQKLIKPKSTPPAKRRGVILSHNIDYGERDGDQVSLIVTSAQERILGGGLLFQAANKWLPGVANREWQETVALIGIKIAMLTQFILNSAVEPSSDGQYHLDVEIAADNPTHYTIRLRYPQGQGGGITSVTAIDLPAGSQPTASYNAETGALQLGIPRGANGQSVTSVTAVALPAGSQPTATYNSTTGALQLGIPRCSCAGEIPPPPNTDAQKCGAARLYAERVLVLSSKLATDLSTGLTAFQAATTTGAAVAFAFGVTVAPPIAIAIAAVELFASIGAAVINGYNDQATQDEIAKAIYCQLRAQNITSANGMAQVLSAAFANNANKAAWFANTARLLGDDLTTRILGIGAQEPSNACALYTCPSNEPQTITLRLDFTTNPPSLPPNTTLNNATYNPFFRGSAQIALTTFRKVIGVRYSLGSGVAAAELYLRQDANIVRTIGTGYTGIYPPPPYPELCNFLQIGVVGGQGLRWIEIDLQLP
jgi:hypothetical protein